MKEERIEILDPLKGPKPLTRDLAGCARMGVIIVGRIPAFERDFANGIFSLHKIVPEGGQIGGFRILARHPDNSNGLFTIHCRKREDRRSRASLLSFATGDRFSCLKTLLLGDLVLGEGWYGLHESLLLFEQFFFQETCHLTNGGVIVDTARFQLACVSFVERLYPFHADNRI